MKFIIVHEAKLLIKIEPRWKQNATIKEAVSEGSESQKLEIKVKKETDKEKGEKEGEEEEEETSEQVRVQIYSRVGVRCSQIRFFFVRYV
jgi:hypothetical protein